ncbi:hypothetical protein F5H01DRAFT_82072 [Linnemannia elongata]|nr:hypothetical protein F5H01DRAFT_82072 [Linnemannia elongata]
MGLDRIKSLLTDTETVEAIGFIHSGALCVLEVLRNDLLIDVAYGKLTPTVRKPRSRPAVPVDPKRVHAAAPSPRLSSKSTSTSSTSAAAAAATTTTAAGRRPSTASSDQRVASPSPRMSPMMSPSPRISPMNRQSPSPSPLLKPSPGLFGAQPPRPTFSPSVRPATGAQPGQSGQPRPSPSPSLRPVQQQQQQQQANSQGLSSRLSPSPALRPTQGTGQPRPPMMAARPKTPVSQASSVAPSRIGSASTGGAGAAVSQNPNPHSYSLYPRPPPVQRPPVKEEDDFFSILNGV